MDNLNPEQRKKNMQKIRSKDTEPELKVRKWLWSNGYRYKLHYKYLPGKPDIVLSKYNIVIFIQGCFWHRHPRCKYNRLPRSNQSYWLPKLNGNVLRDKENYKTLKKQGWSVIIVWECELKKTFEKRMKKLEKEIRN